MRNRNFEVFRPTGDGGFYKYEYDNVYSYVCANFFGEVARNSVFAFFEIIFYAIKYMVIVAYYIIRVGIVGMIDLTMVICGKGRAPDHWYLGGPELSPMERWTDSPVDYDSFSFVDGPYAGIRFDWDGNPIDEVPPPPPGMYPPNGPYMPPGMHSNGPYPPYDIPPPGMYSNGPYPPYDMPPPGMYPPNGPYGNMPPGMYPPQNPNAHPKWWDV